MKSFIIILLICTFSSFSYSDSAIDLIIVDKSERELKLMKNGITIKEYRIDLGFDPVGHKYFKGDGKTPEGLYHIEEKLNKSSFYLALKISYPNPWDIRRALNLNLHPGGQIMIHGLPNADYDLKYHNKLNDWTEGCIAVSNKEMLYLWKNIEKGVPILIRR